ncbi:MAG: hypothetical protein ABIH72_05815 [archaeon]
MKRKAKKLVAIVVLIVVMLVLICLLINSIPKQSKYDRAIELGGKWFLNNQDPYFLYYIYDVEQEVHPEEYHYLRSSASLWSVAKLANYLDDKSYGLLAKRGFEFFENYFEADAENDFIFLNITPDNIKLGYSAFLILTLTEMEHEEKEYYLEKFANGILYSQNDDGSLNAEFYSGELGSQDYYPGEALFALMTLYETNGEQRYLEAVENAFPYYSSYWRKNRNTAFVPWQSRAYQKLYNANPDDEVRDFVFEMNDWMLEQHSPKGNCSDFDFSGGIVTSVYVEGVNRAYELASDVGDNERARCYKNFVIEGLDATLDLQVTDREKYEIEAIGGFLGSNDSTTQRVDRNQHAVMSLMEARELGII